MAQSDLRVEIARRFDLLRATKWPTGAARIAGIGDADVDLAEIDGYVAGLASQYLEKRRLPYDRIPLSRKLAATFSGTASSEETKASLEPWVRRWRLLLELSELLEKTGKVRIEWED